MLVWNAFAENWNGKNIETINIFDHAGFRNDCDKAWKKYKDDRETFEKTIHRELFYYFCSKCEWEIILDSMFERKDFEQKKIDVYDQVNMNWDIFINYVWNEYNKKRRKERSAD